MEELKKYLKDGNREKSLNYVLNLLKEGKQSLISIYDEILLPISRGIECDIDDKDICEWKGHMQRSIIRTIVENCYSYVIKEKKDGKGTAIVLCPPEEFYDLEARIFTDYLSLLGYDSIFVGGDTPYEDFYNVISVLNPKVVFICVDNYFNVVSTKKIIEDIKSKQDNKTKIIVGGKAFLENSELFEKTKADYCATNFKQLENWK